MLGAVAVRYGSVHIDRKVFNLEWDLDPRTSVAYDVRT